MIKNDDYGQSIEEVLFSYGIKSAQAEKTGDEDGVTHQNLRIDHLYRVCMEPLQDMEIEFASLLEETTDEEDSDTDWEGMKNSLHALVTGAVVTQKVRMYAGKAESAVCACCGDGDEDIEHLLWTCKAWSRVRDEHNLSGIGYQSWPTAMKYCGLYVPGEGRPPPADWSNIQCGMASILAARHAYLEDNGMYDKPSKTKQSKDACRDDGERKHVATPTERSKMFPLFKRIAKDIFDSAIDIQWLVPKFSIGNAGSFEWGDLGMWQKLHEYWSNRRYRTAIAGPGTTWAEIALDIVNTYGIHVLARSDDERDMRCLIRRAKGASKRLGRLCGFGFEDGQDSKRLRPLWIPAVASASFTCELNGYEKINKQLEEWGKFALRLEVGDPSAAHNWKKKASWRPTVDTCVARRRLSAKQSPGERTTL
eukprot:TRINITY_DN33386_c0_g1_i11.p1 TRINITY_DN33386_c0_g1~~TRINITY_DN33386_c0_g1_i11.p1  ORF type:complete len:422 (+),score=65.63 TRINITY_DN33386_c0_g1_i11:780-2045(+)